MSPVECVGGRDSGERRQRWCIAAGSVVPGSRRAGGYFLVSTMMSASRVPLRVQVWPFSIISAPV